MKSRLFCSVYKPAGTPSRMASLHLSTISSLRYANNLSTDSLRSIPSKMTDATTLKTSDMTTAVVLMYPGPSPTSEKRIVRMTADVCTISRISAMYLYGTKITPNFTPGRASMVKVCSRLPCTSAHVTSRESLKGPD